MAELPQLVRERLRNQAGVSEHPDANLLSGFAEHTLTEPERAGVLDHLSRCAECREIVALSTPEVQQEVQVAAAAVPRAPEVAGRSWWRSPVVHWGALAAAALVVLIAVGERMRLREGRSASAPAIAKYEPAPPPTAATEATPATPEPKESRTPAAAARPPSTPNRPKAMGAGSVGKLATADKLATSRGIPSEAGAQSAPPAPPPPAAPPMKPHYEFQDEFQAGKTDSSQSESALKRSPGGVGSGASGGVGKAGGVAGGVVGGTPRLSEATILAQDRSAMLAKRASLGARWSISDSGAVQRSFDGGRSWKDVAVAAGVTFRAVSVVANDVWVGGSGGALFHSADGGEHWTRVRVQTDGRELSGDILRIEFADVANGVVSTSTGESWRTLDAGATWRLQ